MDEYQIIKEANRRAYGRIAATWEQRTAETYDFALHERCRELFVEHLPGPRILELGCGLGWDSHYFCCKGYDVTATDFQEAFIDLARSRNSRVKTLVMDMMEPHVFPEPFHGIYGFASFLHVPGDRSAETIRRLAGLLHDKGVLFLHHVKSMRGLDRYIQEALLVDDNPAYCFCHSEKEMERMLLDAGFSIILFRHLASGKPKSPLAERLGLESYQAIAIR